MWFYFVLWVEVLPSSVEEVLSVAMALSRPLLDHLHCLVVTLGESGVLVCGEHEAGSVNLQPRKHKKVMATYIQPLTLAFFVNVHTFVSCFFS